MKWVLAAAAMLLVIVGASVGTASATHFCVVGTPDPTTDCASGSGPGGTFTLTSSNSSLTVSGAIAPVTCANTTLTVTAPATTEASTISAPSTLRQTSCVYGGFPATVTPGAACDAGGTSALTLSATVDTDTATLLTLPAGCAITVTIPAVGCDMQIAGPQAIGNGTTGAGGQTWSNGTSSGSTDVFTANTLSASGTGTGIGCPSAGAHSATLTATARVTAPATAPGARLAPAPQSLWRHNRGVGYPGGAFNGHVTSVNIDHAAFERGTDMIICTAGDITLNGTLGGFLNPSSTGVVGRAPFAAAAVSPVGTTCSDGSDTYNIVCAAGQYFPTTYTATTYANAAGQVSTGSLKGLICNVKLIPADVQCGSITGELAMSYTNPTTVGGVLKKPPNNALGANTSNDGYFTTTAPAGMNQNLTYTRNGTNCSWASGDVKFGTAAVPQGAVRFALTGAPQPVIWFGTL